MSTGPGRCAGLLLIALIAGLSLACSSSKANVSYPTPLPGERINLQTTTATKYYLVHGTTSDTIFDYISRNGPTDDAGQRGSGLTTAKWSYDWKGQATKDGCAIAKLNISLDLVMTIPKHEATDTLTAATLKNWNTFADGVATHEQHHVDIYLDGANTMKEMMDAIQPQQSCDLLQTQIGNVWSDEQKTIETAQNDFHKAEDTRLSGIRQPLQTQIDTNRTKISSLGSQIKNMDDQIESLRRNLQTAQDQINPVEAQMQSLKGAYGNNMPPSVAASYEALQTQDRNLIANYNALVDQHNNAIERRTSVSSDYDQLLATTKDLVESYNWIR